VSEGVRDDQDQARRSHEKVAGSGDRGARTGGSATSWPTAGRYTPPDTRSLAEKTIDDHPLALLAGSLVMGVVAANFFHASLLRRLGSRMLGAVVVAGELGARAGNKTLEAAAEAGRSGQERLTRLGDLVAEEGAEVRRRAAELGSHAGRRALSLAEEAAHEAREKGSHAIDRLGKLARKH
jgi:hypothetical protein